MTPYLKENRMNFSWPTRVYYEDTDSGGVVYYANYLKFMERARTEYIRGLGVEQDDLAKNENVIFAVRSVNVEYLKPARFNDALIVTAKVIELKKTRMLFEQNIILQQDQTLLCTGETLIASLRADTFRPVAVPQILREAFSVD
jgi:acyl-CoA thioester hydrolase